MKHKSTRPPSRHDALAPAQAGARQRTPQMDALTRVISTSPRFEFKTAAQALSQAVDAAKQG